MQLMILHGDDKATKNRSDLLQSAITTQPFANAIIDALIHANSLRDKKKHTFLAVPNEQAEKSYHDKPVIPFCGKKLPINLEHPDVEKANDYLVISDARFVTEVDLDWLYSILGRMNADVTTVNVKLELNAFREKVRLTSQGKVAFFRRLYRDSMQQAPVPTDWPHYLFIKVGILEKLLVDRTIPLDFHELISRCEKQSLQTIGLNVAGTVCDLQCEGGFLAFIQKHFSDILPRHPSQQTPDGTDQPNNNHIDPDVRLFGSILLGKNVTIRKNAVLVGPTIICDNVKIETGAVIKSSVIGSDNTIPPNHYVHNRAVLHPHANWQQPASATTSSAGQSSFDKTHFLESNHYNNRFRTWPRFAYPRACKRLADIFAAIFILILFVPFLPVIALLVKLSSTGPIFYKDKRQGRFGREFSCFKFRSMMTGANEVQDMLRVINQVDGPQFKMEDDPRVTGMGRFLRDTHLDELPQFINVLFGQMSLVGPRPSPEAENSLCPWWCDARLSVRPGITGLWQVSRTRIVDQDFQEWIYYDTKYIKNLSWKLDLKICLITIVKLVKGFVRQF